MQKNNGKGFLFLLLIALTLAVIFASLGCNKAFAANKIKNSNFSCTYSQVQKKAIGENAVCIPNAEKTNNLQKDNLSCANGKEKNIELLCLMYHNVVSDKQKQGDYEMRVSSVAGDFAWLKKNAYQCVTPNELLGIVDNQKFGKYVMITFDDGFYGVYKHIPPLLEKYNMKCVVSVTGEFIDMADKQNYKTRCSYMNSNEVKQLAQNARVVIAHHSYDYHHINNGLRGVRKKQNESASQYEQRFLRDTKKLENKLSDYGITTQIYCYPFGEYCKESESILKNLDYKVTMTCNEKINYLTDRNSLYLLGRINRAAKYQNLSNLPHIGC